MRSFEASKEKSSGVARADGTWAGNDELLNHLEGYDLHEDGAWAVLYTR